MQKIATQLQQAREALVAVAGESAGLEARLLAAHAWGMTPEMLVREAETVGDAAAFQTLLARRLRREPMAQILGMKPFWRDVFRVTADVLTPRADSETMIDLLLRLRADKAAALRLLDLGTGSGCLLLSALREYPHARGMGADQSDAALAVAQHNASALGLTERVDFVRSDWCSAVAGMYDVVLSNPPYIATADIASLDEDVRVYEPRGALDGGADGLDCYRAILSQVQPHLVAGGLLLFEVGMGQADDVAALGAAQGLQLLEITNDLAGIARVVAFQSTTN